MDAAVLSLRGDWMHALAAEGNGIIDISQIFMLVLVVGALTVVLLATRRRVHNSLRQPSHTAREQFSQLKEQSKATRDVGQVMLELDQLSRQLHGRLDTKLARLEAVIQDADGRIDKLSRLVRRADGEPQLEITLDREEPYEAPPPEPTQEEGDRHTAVYRLADDGTSPIEIAQHIGRPVGEIDLILALRQTREKSGAGSEPSTAARSPSHQ